MQNFMKPNVVKAFIEGRKKKGQFATVVFLKKNGEIRRVNGLFAPKSHLVGSERGIQQGKEMAARGQVFIWEVNSKAPKSFYLDRVIDVS